MSEPDTHASTPNTAAANAEPPIVKVVQDIPVVFVDGVTQHITAPGISKFYLYRSDANPKDPTSFSNLAVIQVIMPAIGFADMVAFFEHRLKVMVQRGDLSQAVVDERRDSYSKMPIV
jgi:hypothetical protein